MDLHASSWICMHSGTFCNILPWFKSEPKPLSKRPYPPTPKKWLACVITMNNFKGQFTEEAFLFSTFVEKSRLVIESVNGFFCFCQFFSDFLGHPGPRAQFLIPWYATLFGPLLAAPEDQSGKSGQFSEVVFNSKQAVRRKSGEFSGVVFKSKQLLFSSLWPKNASVTS